MKNELELRVPLADRVCLHWAYERVLKLAKAQLGAKCWLVECYTAFNCYWFVFST